jgi:hypothetical protein
MISAAVARSIPYPPLLQRSPPDWDAQYILLKYVRRCSIQNVINVVYDLHYQQTCHIMHLIFIHKRCSDVFPLVLSYLEPEQSKPLPRKSYVVFVSKLIRCDGVRDIDYALQIAKQSDAFLAAGRQNEAECLFETYKYKFLNFYQFLNPIDSLLPNDSIMRCIWL